ncbi:hypothetical protein C8Q74DRAFT_1000539 [Fomes fomentarius]|nr:hypothetical protein C8Q74DRAFT_1000539 [Fomes fomentarius]
MQSKLVKRTSLSASHPELDAKLELLQQLGYGDRYILEDDASLSEKGSFLDDDRERWIRSEYSWALEEAAESNVRVPDLFDVVEDEESCLPYVYDPTFFAASMPPTPRSRSESFSQPRSAVDKVCYSCNLSTLLRSTCAFRVAFLKGCCSCLTACSTAWFAPFFSSFVAELRRQNVLRSVDRRPTTDV